MKTFTKAACALLVPAGAMWAPQAAAQSPLGPPLLGQPAAYYYDGSLIPNVDPACVLTLSPYGLGVPLLTRAPGSLRNTCASMLRGRQEHTATTLGNGRVLIAGGDADVAPAAGDTLNCAPRAVDVNLGGAPCPAPYPTIIADAELYDPTLSVFLPAGAMGHARTLHLAVRLNDGRVLIVGGVGPQGAADPGATAELYDPGSGQFYATGSLAQARSVGATATVLPNGRVLVAGGAKCGSSFDLNYSCDPPTASAELYDPATGRFTPTGSLGTARMQHAAVLLASGKVLILGGQAVLYGSALASAEIYDPATGKFSAAGSTPWAIARPAAARLPGGGVLVVDTGAAAIYNPASGQFTGIYGPSLAIGDGPDAALSLPDGRVFLKAGWCNRPQLFDPASKTFSVAGTNLPLPVDPYTTCSSAAAALLQTGEPLTTGAFSYVEGGREPGYYEFFKQAQLFHP